MIIVNFSLVKNYNLKDIYWLEPHIISFESFNLSKGYNGFIFPSNLDMILFAPKSSCWPTSPDRQLLLGKEDSNLIKSWAMLKQSSVKGLLFIKATNSIFGS